MTRFAGAELIVCKPQAEGDLSFAAGDKIQLVKKTDSAEDWWTGKLNGQEGVFPGASQFARCWKFSGLTRPGFF